MSKSKKKTSDKKEVDLIKIEANTKKVKEVKKPEPVEQELKKDKVSKKRKVSVPKKTEPIAESIIIKDQIVGSEIEADSNDTNDILDIVADMEVPPHQISIEVSEVTWFDRILSKFGSYLKRKK